MTTPDKLKELEDNEYLETVSVRLEQLEIGIKVAIDNIQTEIKELFTRTDSIIRDMEKDLEQIITVITEMPKSISCLKSPSSTILTISTTIPVKPQTSPSKTIEPSSSTPFLEKDKEMPELKAKLLAKRNTNPIIQTKKFVPFYIFDPFIAGYHKKTQLIY